MSRTAAELIRARSVAHQYRDMARSIDVETADPKLRNMPLTIGILRHYARIVRRAAIAEELDPEVP
jgi:hypothetical protein